MTSSDAPKIDDPLLLLRLSGQPTETVEPFGSRVCVDRLEALRSAEIELEATRREIVELVYPLVKGASAKMRRFLLSVKRDCFNGRSMKKRLRTAEWREFKRLIGAPSDRLIELEDEVEECRGRFDELYEREREREHRHLLGFLEDRRLIRGIAVGSPSLAAQLERLESSSSAHLGRRQRKLQLTLLRYLSRASLKLSPFSTLTVLALGRLVESTGKDGDATPDEKATRDEHAALHAGPAGGGWVEHSLLRTQRYFLDQMRDLLLAHPHFQAELDVVLNETIEELDSGHFRWLRPGRWEIDEAQMRFRQDAFVKARLEGPLVASLRDALSTSGCSRHREIVAGLGKLHPGTSRAQISATIDKLRRIGFVHLRTPWPSNEGHLEARMATDLEAFAGQPELKRLAEELQRLVSLERSFSATDDPVAALADLERQVDRVWRRGRELGEPGTEIDPQRIKQNHFTEDVIVEPADGASSPEVVRLPAARMHQLAKTVEPLVALANLFNRRHDFLLALGSFISETWPGARELGVLELFEASKPLHRSWVSFRRTAGPADTWNPFALEVTGNLHELRARATRLTKSAITSSGGESRIRSVDLRAFLSSLPDELKPPVGGCLFLQPADSTGRTWVLNHLYEGTGRYGSRYTPLLPPAARDRYTAGFVAGSAREWNGEQVELLDLMYPHGDTLNIHARMTRRILLRPGERADAAAGCHVSLKDLRVRLDPGSAYPRLVDTEGRRYLPVHLGGATHRYIPALFRFLSLFGPEEVDLKFLSPRTLTEEQIGFRERLRIDDIVVYRKRWFFEQETLPQGLSAGSEKEAFLAFDAWRRERQLPDRLFLIENIAHPSREDLYKPQYLDLTSPLFVTLLRSALKSHRGVVSFEEMMPTPEAALVDAEGRHWMIEILLDSLGIAQQR